MSATDLASPADRVKEAVAAARRIADPHDPLGLEARARLPEASGLSPAGVELALSEHLEVHPAHEEIELLVRSCGRSSRCGVVLAANVCTAALRAIACALATAPEVWVRPSRRDPVMAELLVRVLAERGLQISIEQRVATRPGDELHLYGSDGSLAEIVAALPAGVRVRRHGSGLGIALVLKPASLEQAATALARDLLPFDGRGCLSPRFAFVEGGPERAEQLAEQLHGVLEQAARTTPRGPLDADAHFELNRFRAAYELAGRTYGGNDHLIAFDPAPEALLLPPPQRCLTVVPIDTVGLGSLLSPWAGHVTALGVLPSSEFGSELLLELTALCPSARRSLVGQMQKPPFDGPVDLRS